jgi:hypothetical protein
MQQTPPLMLSDTTLDVALCKRSPEYFIQHFVQIYDSSSKDWIPFELWPAQRQALHNLQTGQLHVWLKARQIGLTWLALAYELWLMRFQPIANCLNFSLRETEAIELISDNRLRGMYSRLPHHLQLVRAPLINDKRQWQLGNNSIARAFPGGTGDSYTATYALIDEADLILNLDQTISSVKPTIEAGGKLVLLSRANKRLGDTSFKKIYRAAQRGESEYQALFFPWHVHPDRDQHWYDRQVANASSQDEIAEQYPTTDTEALAMGYVGRVYPMFNYADHVTKAAEYDPDHDILWGVDLGYTNPTFVVMLQYVAGKFRVFAEFERRQMLVPEILREMLLSGSDTAPLFPFPTTIYYDTESATFRPEAEGVFNEARQWADVWGANKRRLDGIRTIQRYLKTGELIIHPRCKSLIHAIENYVDDNRASDADPRPAVGQSSSHACDALRYALTPYFYQTD